MHALYLSVLLMELRAPICQTHPSSSSHHPSPPESDQTSSSLYTTDISMNIIDRRAMTETHIDRIMSIVENTNEYTIIECPSRPSELALSFRLHRSVMNTTGITTVRQRTGTLLRSSQARLGLATLLLLLLPHATRHACRAPARRWRRCAVKNYHTTASPVLPVTNPSDIE